MVVAIDQHNALQRFDCSNYRLVLEISKELLDILYKKVQTSEEFQFEMNACSFAREAPSIKRCNIGQDVEQLQKKPPKERPNHIYSSTRPQFLQNPVPSKPIAKASEIKFLRERLQSFQVQFSKIRDALS